MEGSQGAQPPSHVQEISEMMIEVEGIGVIIHIARGCRRTYDVYGMLMIILVKHVSGLKM